MPRFFLSVPSPLHGTSHNILSNNNCCCFLEITLPFVPEGDAICSEGILIAGYMDASKFVTIKAGLGRRDDWCMSMCVRLLSLSFAMRRPEGKDEAVIVS